MLSSRFRDSMWWGFVALGVYVAYQQGYLASWGFGPPVPPPVQQQPQPRKRQEEEAGSAAQPAPSVDPVTEVSSHA